MQTRLGNSPWLTDVRSWFVRVWRAVADSIGDPVDRLVGPAPWDDTPLRKTRIQSS